jgi:hypothetical protein
MTTCVTCGEYFRLNPWHQNHLECFGCSDSGKPNYQDEDLELEKSTLLNPTGKTRAVFYDDDSYGL